MIGQREFYPKKGSNFLFFRLLKDIKIFCFLQEKFISLVEWILIPNQRIILVKMKRDT